MKQKTNFQLILSLLIAGLSLLFLENRRIENRRIFDKATRKVSGEANGFNLTNTDHIFFESLSKYLFISN